MPLVGVQPQSSDEDIILVLNVQDDSIVQGIVTEWVRWHSCDLISSAGISLDMRVALSQFYGMWPELCFSVGHQQRQNVLELCDRLQGPWSKIGLLDVLNLREPAATETLWMSLQVDELFLAFLPMCTMLPFSMEINKPFQICRTSRSC
jgi:hypothetical protein